MKLANVIEHDLIPLYARHISSHKELRDKYFPGTKPGSYTPFYQNEDFHIIVGQSPSDIVELYSSEDFFIPYPSVHCYVTSQNHYVFPEAPYNNCQITDIKRLVSISLLSSASNAGIEARIPSISTSVETPIITPSYYRYSVPFFPNDYDIKPIRWGLSCNSEYMDISPTRFYQYLLDDDAPGFDPSYYFSPQCPLSCPSTRIDYGGTGVHFYAVPAKEDLEVIFPVQLQLDYEVISVFTQLKEPQYINNA